MRFTVECYQTDDEWYAEMVDQEADRVGVGMGRTALDAASNAAINAANREFSERREQEGR